MKVKEFLDDKWFLLAVQADENKPEQNDVKVIGPTNLVCNSLCYSDKSVQRKIEDLVGLHLWCRAESVGARAESHVTSTHLGRREDQLLVAGHITVMLLAFAVRYDPAGFNQLMEPCDLVERTKALCKRC